MKTRTILLTLTLCFVAALSVNSLGRSLLSGAGGSISMVAADLNGDGKPDLVIVKILIDFVPPNVDIVFHK